MAHPLMEPPDELPMLDQLSLEVRVRTVALHGQIDHEEGSVTDLFRSEDAAYLIGSGSAKLTPQLADASVV